MDAASGGVRLYLKKGREGVFDCCWLAGLKVSEVSVSLIPKP